MTDDAWERYRKTAPVDAVLIEDASDIPDDATGRVAPGHTEALVETPEGTPDGVGYPFFLLRTVDGPAGHVWPVDPDTFRATYTPVDEATVPISRETAQRALLELNDLIQRTQDEDPDPLCDAAFEAKNELAQRLVDGGEKIKQRLETVDPEGHELDHALASPETVRRACLTLETRLKKERAKRQNGVSA